MKIIEIYRLGHTIHIYHSLVDKICPVEFQVELCFFAKQALATHGS